MSNLTELPCFDIIVNKSYDREISVDMTHSDLLSCLLGQLIDLTALVRRHCHGLLEEKITSVLKSKLRDLKVKSRRNRNGHDIGLNFVNCFLIILEVTGIRIKSLCRFFGDINQSRQFGLLLFLSIAFRCLTATLPHPIINTFNFSMPL